MNFRKQRSIHNGRFNINLLSLEAENPKFLYFDNISSNNFFPYINITPRHRSRSKTLINNIQHNGINANTVSGNITNNISDQIAQFLINSCQGDSKGKSKENTNMDY